MEWSGATSGEGEKCQQLTESPQVFPSNAEVGSVFTALAIPAGAVFLSGTECTNEGWAAIPQEDWRKTFREQGLTNGSLVLVQDSSNNNSSLLTKQGEWITTVNETDWIQVKNLCPSESEEAHVKVPATANTLRTAV